MSQDKAFLRNKFGGPHIGTDVAYHIENKTFVAYLETCAARLGIDIQDDKVADFVTKTEEPVTHARHHLAHAGSKDRVSGLPAQPGQGEL